MRIRLINPVVKGAVDEHSLPPVPRFVTVEPEWLAEGSASIECRTDSARSQAAVLDRVEAAVVDGVDGIVLNCFMDPALESARELASVPVAGPGQSGMSLAATVGDRFSVILPSTSGIPIARRQARQYVGLDRVASIRGIEMPVAELHDGERLIEALTRESNAAIDEDGADVIVLGCTGMSYATAAVKERVAERGVPVIDPTLAAIGSVVAQSIQGIGHSAVAYALPTWR